MKDIAYYNGKIGRIDEVQRLRRGHGPQQEDLRA